MQTLPRYAGYNEDILRRIYLQLLPVTALNVLLPSLGTIINSFIISSLLGADAMAALGIVSPLATFFWVFVNIISDGAAILSGRCLAGATWTGSAAASPRRWPFWAPWAWRSG